MTLSPVCSGTVTGARSMMRAGGPLDRQPLAARHRAIAIQGPAKRVDDTPQQCVAHRHVHDPSGAPDFVASLQA